MNYQIIRKIILWIGIVVLLGLVAFGLHAHLSHNL